MEMVAIIWVSGPAERLGIASYAKQYCLRCEAILLKVQSNIASYAKHVGSYAKHIGSYANQLFLGNKKAPSGLEGVAPLSEKARAGFQRLSIAR